MLVAKINRHKICMKDFFNTPLHTLARDERSNVAIDGETHLEAPAGWRHGIKRHRMKRAGFDQFKKPIHFGWGGTVVKHHCDIENLRHGDLMHLARPQGFCTPRIYFFDTLEEKAPVGGL